MGDAIIGRGIAALPDSRPAPAGIAYLFRQGHASAHSPPFAPRCAARITLLCFPVGLPSDTAQDPDEHDRADNQPFVKCCATDVKTPLTTAPFAGRSGSVCSQEAT